LFNHQLKEKGKYNFVKGNKLLDFMGWYFFTVCLGWMFIWFLNVSERTDSKVTSHIMFEE